MNINTISNKIFELLNENKLPVASHICNNHSLDDAVIEMSEKCLLSGINTATWVTIPANDKSGKIKSKIRVETGG